MMKKYLSEFTAFGLCALLALLVSSCDDSDQEVHNPTVYNIVEFASRDESGTTFLYYPAPGNSPVTLRAKSSPATKVKPGECLFLGYTENRGKRSSEPEVPASEIQISVRSLAQILNTEVHIANAEELRGWDAEPIELLAMWRAGEKVILRCLLTADSEPRHFGLLIDEATLGDPVPTAYLYHRRENPIPNYTSQYYTAFSLAPLLRPEGEASRSYTALRVKVANAANPAVNEILIPLGE